MLLSAMDHWARVITRLVCLVPLFAGVGASQQVTLYSHDPNQIWNRVHSALHVRVASDGSEYGAEELDPLLWVTTKHLLSGKSHDAALAVLNEFVEQRAERLITDPVRRAIFQHDLWRVFDWADTFNTDPNKSSSARELQLALARVMRSVSLDDKRIQSLPDNLQEAIAAHAVPDFLTGLFDAHAPWVCVYPPGADPVGSTHASVFSESTFLVFIRLPGGRADTLAYLAKLNEFHDSITKAHFGPNTVLQQNPAIPQFPPGTRSVLLRQMMLVDQNGRLVPTRLTLSLQTRLYRTVPSNAISLGEREEAEYDLSREKLFARDAGSLTAVGKDEARFSVFMSHGDDPFEIDPTSPKRFPASRVLSTCHACHEASGIHSVCSYMCNARVPEVHFFLTDVVGLFEGDPNELRQSDLRAKQSRHDFGLLEGLWNFSKKF